MLKDPETLITKEVMEFNEVHATDEWADIVTEGICRVQVVESAARAEGEALREAMRVELRKYFADIAREEHADKPHPSMADDPLYYRWKMEKAVAIVLALVGPTRWQPLYTHPDIQDVVRAKLWWAIGNIIQAQRG